MVHQQRGSIHFTYTMKALAKKRCSSHCRSHRSRRTQGMSAIAAQSVLEILTPMSSTRRHLRYPFATELRNARVLGVFSNHFPPRRRFFGRILKVSQQFS